MTGIVDDLKNIFRPKKTKIVIIAIIVFFILGPILGLTTTKIPIRTATAQVIEGDSTDNHTLAYAVPFTIQQDQSCIIEFSAHYNSTSVTLIITGQGIYGSADPNGSDPDGFTRKNFMLSRFERGTSPINSKDVVSSAVCTGDDFYYLEFLGDGNTGTERISSEPGAYVIVVYVTSGTISGVFDLKVYLEGPGEILFNVFILIGLCMILGLLGVAAAILIKKFLEV